MAEKGINSPKLLESVAETAATPNPGRDKAAEEKSNERKTSSTSEGEMAIINTEDTLKVSLQRTASNPTSDQALWAAIRNSAKAISFKRYDKFISVVFCEGSSQLDKFLNESIKAKRDAFDGIFNNGSLQLNIRGHYSYAVLKLATQAFLTLQTGIKPKEPKDGCRLLRRNGFNTDDVLFDDKEDAAEEVVRRGLNELSDETIIAKLAGQLSGYLGETGGHLPYLNRIAGALLTVNAQDDKMEESYPYCQRILQYRLTQPSLMELIWSYWLEQGMQVQTMNAIALRFQNQRSRPNDPLAELEIDPLMPLSNIIWGYSI